MSPQIDPAAPGTQSHETEGDSGSTAKLGGTAADILRAAADRIDRVVAKISPNLADHRQLVGFLRRGNTVPPGLVTWLHVAPPQVIGPPLAAWLRDHADYIAAVQCSANSEALALAHALLGDEA